MGSRELLLTIGALVIFCLTTATVNQLTMSHAEGIYGRQAEWLAINLAQQFIEEAKTKAFDELTITDAVASESDMTGNGSLGPDGSESYPNFDDVDDFDGLDRTVTVTGGYTMHVEAEVTYVNDSALSTAISTKDYFKRMVVKVSSESLLNPVQAVYIFSYQKN